jgi:hypothetical protein
MATINRFEDFTNLAGNKNRLAKEIHLIAVETDLKSDFRFKEQIRIFFRFSNGYNMKGLKEIKILNLTISINYKSFCW